MSPVESCDDSCRQEALFRAAPPSLDFSISAADTRADTPVDRLACDDFVNNHLGVYSHNGPINSTFAGASPSSSSLAAGERRSPPDYTPGAHSVQDCCGATGDANFVGHDDERTGCGPAGCYCGSDDGGYDRSSCNNGSTFTAGWPVVAQRRPPPEKVLGKCCANCASALTLQQVHQRPDHHPRYATGVLRKASTTKARMTDMRLARPSRNLRSLWEAPKDDDYVCSWQSSNPQNLDCRPVNTPDTTAADGATRQTTDRRSTSYVKTRDSDHPTSSGRGRRSSCGGDNVGRKAHVPADGLPARPTSNPLPSGARYVSRLSRCQGQMATSRQPADKDNIICFQRWLHTRAGKSPNQHGWAEGRISHDPGGVKESVVYETATTDVPAQRQPSYTEFQVYGVGSSLIDSDGNKAARTIQRGLSLDRLADDDISTRAQTLQSLSSEDSFGIIATMHRRVDLLQLSSIAACDFEGASQSAAARVSTPPREDKQHGHYRHHREHGCRMEIWRLGAGADRYSSAGSCDPEHFPVCWRTAVNRYFSERDHDGVVEEFDSMRVPWGHWRESSESTPPGSGIHFAPSSDSGDDFGGSPPENGQFGSRLPSHSQSPADSMMMSSPWQCLDIERLENQKSMIYNKVFPAAAAVYQMEASSGKSSWMLDSRISSECWSGIPERTNHCNGLQEFVTLSREQHPYGSQQRGQRTNPA